MENTTTPKLSRKVNMWPFALSLFLLVLVNAINYWHLSEFSYPLPLVDIVQVLVKPENQMSPKPNILIDLLRDIYLRLEPTYLETLANSTIVVEPVLTVKSYLLTLLLKEGYLFVSPSHKVSVFPLLSIESVLRQKLQKSNAAKMFEYEVSNFIERFIFPLDPFHHFSDDVGRNLASNFRLLEIGNCGLLFSTLLLFAAANFYEYRKPKKDWGTFAVIFGIHLGALSLVTFSIINLLTAARIDLLLANFKSHFICISYLIQLLISIFCCIRYIYRAKRQVSYILAEREIRRQTKDFKISPTSSVYSSVNMKNDLSPIQESKSSPPENTLDPMKQICRSNLGISIPPSYLTHAGPVLVRSPPKIGVFKSTPSPQNDTRSFSAPVFATSQGVSGSLASPLQNTNSLSWATTHSLNVRPDIKHSGSTYSTKSVQENDIQSPTQYDPSFQQGAPSAKTDVTS